MRLVFMGSPDFAVPSLKALQQQPFEIAAVVTAPDRARGRGRQVSFTAVKTAALELGLPVLQPESLSDPAFINDLKNLAPDLTAVVAFSILPEPVIDIPVCGTINLHASLLPRYRGAAPIQWAIINGEKETGVSIFFIERSVDTGKIIRQSPEPIGPDDTAGDLFNRLSMRGAALLCESVRDIERGVVKAIEQDHSLATRAPKLKKTDGLVDWAQPAQNIHNRMRGLYPWPGCYSFWNGKRIVLCKSHVADPSVTEGSPGSLKDTTEDRILVQTGCGILEVLRLKPENGREMGAPEFMRGQGKDRPGRFENDSKD